MNFTYEMEPSHMKINFTHEIFILDMELKKCLYVILFSYVKLYVKFLQGLHVSVHVL